MNSGRKNLPDGYVLSFDEIGRKIDKFTVVRNQEGMKRCLEVVLVKAVFLQVGFGLVVTPTVVG